MGSTVDPIVQVGKGGIGPNLIQQVDDALEARELVKVRVLRNCLEEREVVAEALAGATKAEIAQQIGSNILLYRRSVNKPQIDLP